MVKLNAQRVRTAFGSARTAAEKFVADARGTNVTTAKAAAQEVRASMEKGAGRVMAHTAKGKQHVGWSKAKVADVAKTSRDLTGALEAQGRARLSLGVGSGAAAGTLGGAAIASRRSKSRSYQQRVPQYLPMEQYNELDSIIEELLLEYTPLQDIANRGVRSLAHASSPLARRLPSEIARQKALLKKGGKIVYSSAKKKPKPGLLKRIFASEDIAELDVLMQDIAQGTHENSCEF